MAITGNELPPELAAEQRSIANRRRIAEMMMAQGQKAVQSSHPSAPVSWTQGLAQIANAYLGGRGTRQADQAEAALGQQYQKGLAAEVERIAALRQGQPIQPDPQEIEQSADQGTPAPRVGSTGDPRAAVMAALTSQYAPVREMGKLDFQGDLKERENAAARASRLEERLMILDANSRNDALDRESKERIAKESNDIKLEIAELKSFLQGGGGNPYFTALPTKDGFISFDNRKGTAAPLVVGGRQAVRSTDDPGLQGDIAGAKAGGAARAKRSFNMAGIGQVIQKAEDILSGKDGRPLPTGSGIGTAVDIAAGIFGASPEGAVEAQDMKAVGAALTSKMPRMEGPQSDRDTVQYREMAAMVGDSTVPIERRKSALKAVKELWAKYEHLNPEAFVGDAPGAPGAAAAGVPEGVDPAIWGALTAEEKALWAQ